MSDFESSHVLRDMEIPKHRQHIKESIRIDLSNEVDIIAVFYGGSCGNQYSDNYSDLDLRIVVTDESFEKYRKDKKNRAAKWGEVLFYEDVSYTNYTITHYTNFVKVDTFYFRLKDILPSISLKNIEIVFDSSELLEDIFKKSQTLTFEPTPEDVELWRTMFFATLHETYRRVMRGEIYYALHCLDSLRFFMATAWYMDVGIEPNSLGDWSKIEGPRSQLQDWQLVELAKWGASRDPKEIMSVVKLIGPEFKRIHESLCNSVGMKQDAEWVDKIISKVF